MSLLKDAGFRAFKEFTESPRNGDIFVVGNGGSVLFYVIGHDVDVIQRVVAWLQQTDFAGVIFAREKIEGTFLWQTSRSIRPSLLMLSCRFPGMISLTSLVFVE